MGLLDESVRKIVLAGPDNGGGVAACYHWRHASILSPAIVAAGEEGFKQR
jgi:hypothetical protein